MSAFDGNTAAVAADPVECKCNTCKAIFSSIEKVKEHYRSEWHVFNAKRRSNNLVPLTRDEFKKVRPMIQKTANGVAYTAPVKVSSGGGASSVVEDNSSPKTGGVAGGPTRVGGALSGLTASNPIIGISTAAAAAAATSTVNQGSVADDDGREERDDEDGDEGEDSQPLPSMPNISIFDNVVFDSVDECVEHMALKFGFFIPDIECLTDRDSFLQYLSDKVKLGGYCLYCQKLFKPGYSCQNHMISKSHCKIAYAEGVDLEEYEDFYDYSSTYDEDTEYDEDGNAIETELKLSSIGELVLPNGKVLGHRMYKRYYSQRLQVADPRPSYVAAQREELLRLQAQRFGGGELSSIDVERMTDMQVMTLLMEKQKSIRKNQIIQQRSEIKKQWIFQKREYQSNTDKLRSKATTTERILDYHGTLM
jgi:pre-60S factor REI1